MVNCLLCKDIKDECEIAKLQCNHIFCWICFEKYLKINLSITIKCPVVSCHEIIHDDQIRKALCSEDLQQYENLCLNDLKTAHYCLLPQCGIPVFYEDPNVQFECANCSLYNCIKCQAAHGFSGCEAYQSKSSKDKVKICEQELKRAEVILNNKNASRSREMLLEIDEIDLIKNDSVFTCNLCCSVICKGEGVKLQNCGDLICKSCLLNSIETTTKIPAQCPSCQQSINDREIRAILSDNQFSIYQVKCQDFSKKSIPHFQCQTPNCDAFYEISESLKEFTCKKCKGKNCIKCKTVHLNENCEQFKKRMETDVNMKAIEEKIKNKELMKCPKCSNYIVRSTGCYGIKCSNCSTELCWIRQMERWGPGGYGDTSGGCRCEVDRKKCHPDCIGCTVHNNAMLTENNSTEIISPEEMIFLKFLMGARLRLINDLMRLQNLERLENSIESLGQSRNFEEWFNSRDVLGREPNISRILKKPQQPSNLRVSKNSNSSCSLV